MASARNSALLPPIHDQATLDRRRSEEALWLPAISAIADRHGLGGPERLFPTGSAVVFGLEGDHVVKLHEPWNREHFTTEAGVLSWLDVRCPLPTPGLLASGELEGWGYLVMRRLPGEPLNEVRNRIPTEDMVGIAAATGELCATLQRLPPPESIAFPCFDSLITKMQRGCVARHGEQGLPRRLLETLEGQLEGLDIDSDNPVFLHTELTDQNLMVDCDRSGRWSLSGVFDFEPSMVGHRLYDLPAITIFVGRGDAALCRAALGGYGIDAPDVTLCRQLLGWTLLHRYSHLGYFLEQVGAAGYPESWEELSLRLFGV